MFVAIALGKSICYLLGRMLALGFVLSRRLKNLRQLSHLWWGECDLLFLCSRGVESLMALTSSDCRAHDS